MTNVLRNGDKKGGERVGDNTILSFCSFAIDIKCHIPIYSYMRLPMH